MAKKRKKRYKGKKNASLFFFVLFILIAVLAVALLEYIDFKKGKESFIFSKVVPLKSKPQSNEVLNSKLLKLFKDKKIIPDYFKDEKGIYHYKVTASYKKFPGVVNKLKELAVRFNGELILSEIQKIDQNSLSLYHMHLDKQLTHIILLSRLGREKTKEVARETIPVTPKKKKRRKPSLVSGANMAFIIDDVGEYDIGALELKQLNIPITASILPDSPRAREEARWIEEYKLQALIHLPMQPRNSNGRKYNRNKVITLKSSDREIKSLINRARKIVPNARGINNHEGSLVTANRQVMTRVLNQVKPTGLFFVDSRTIGNTVAYDVAVELDIPAAHKDFFIDHVQTYEDSMNQIRKMVDAALQKGRAIGIGHPHSSTLRAIQDSIPYIESRGVKIVFVSQLVH